MQIFKTKKILKRDEDLKFKTPTDIFGQYIDENLEFDFEFGIESLTKNYDSRYKDGIWRNSIALLFLLKFSTGDFSGFIMLIHRFTYLMRKYPD